MPLPLDPAADRAGRSVATPDHFSNTKTEEQNQQQQPPPPQQQKQQKQKQQHQEQPHPQLQEQKQAISSRTHPPSSSTFSPTEPFATSEATAGRSVDRETRHLMALPGGSEPSETRPTGPGRINTKQNSSNGDTHGSSTVVSGSRSSTGTVAAAPATPTAASPGTKKSSIEINKTRPQDFEGEVATNDELPPQETLHRIKDYVVLDRHGKSHTFKSLYSGRNVARRVLLIFVRHFFCGNCQEYLRTVSESITPEALLGLPVSTFIAVVGCGDPGLIKMYVSETGCPFPVYTDPTRSIFDALGMVRTLALGTRPAYARHSLAKGIVSSIVQGLKQIPRGLATRAGDQRQVGGEFLFEPMTASATAPAGGVRKSNDAYEEDGGGDEDDDEKRVTWCHRMRSTRDHAEVPELMEVLGLDGQGQPARDKRRWTRALELRKGTGISMAGEMGQMSDSSQLETKLREASLAEREGGGEGKKGGEEWEGKKKGGDGEEEREKEETRTSQQVTLESQKVTGTS